MTPAIVVMIYKCARCGKEHGPMETRKFKRPPDGCSHWTTCPKTFEPILISIVKKPGKK